MKYVHVGCLNQWRRAAQSRTAFFECPQCRYKYHFARTRVVGLATDPLVLTALSLAVFIALVFAASFLGSFLLSWFGDDSGGDDGYYYSPYSTSYWFYNPITATRDLVAAAIHLVDDTVNYSDVPRRGPNWSASTPQKLPARPGIIARLLQRFALGLSVVGITSFVQWLWSMSLAGLIRFVSFRDLRNRRDRGGGAILSVIVLVFVVAGAARCAYIPLSSILHIYLPI
jgi:hypothetical protein